MVLLLGLAISIIHALEIKQVYKHSVWKLLKRIILQKKKWEIGFLKIGKSAGKFKFPEFCSEYYHLITFFVL